ncbi:hypothetical protein CBS101457_001941 [Exobasidium rhododendri]|nr:hypothetical protein CBS101457_001941 [Exobasidium rhododendri]
MVLSAFHSQPVRPSGIAHAVALRLTPFDKRDAKRHAHRGRLVSHIVSARDDVVNVYEIRRREEDDRNCIYHLRSHLINGIVTGLGKCRINSHTGNEASTSASEGERDTLVLSFKDAKLTLMQWSDSAADLLTVSIHTYERAAQLSEGLPDTFLPILQVDPDSRCAALLLPQDALAILPFFNDSAEELDELLQMAGDTQGDLTLERSLPYAPSFILSLQSADPAIKNIRDFTFLPNFQRPTIAVLYERQRTWTGRLNELSDSCAIRIITLDLSSSANASHSVISTRDDLPYNCHYLAACPQSIGGGVLIISTFAVLHMDQGGRIVGLAVSEWHSQTSRLSLPEASFVKDVPNGTSTGEDTSQKTSIELANSCVTFPDASMPVAIIVLEDGSIWTINCALEGRTLTSMSFEFKGRTVQPSTAAALPQSDMLLVSSMLGQASLLKVTKLQVAIEKQETEVDDIDMDLDAELYGDSSNSNTTNGGAQTGKSKMELLIENVATIPAFGPIHDIASAVINDSETDGGLPQTVICAGANAEGGLIFLEPQIIPRRKRRLALNATNGVWFIRSEIDTDRIVIVTSSLDSTLISRIDANGLIVFSVPLHGRTIFACRVEGKAETPLLIRATPRRIETLTEDGTIMQSFRAGQSKDKKEEIFKVQSAAGHVAVLWTDGSLQLFARQGEGVQAVALPDEIAKRKFISANIIVDKYDNLHMHTAKKEELAAEVKMELPKTQTSSFAPTEEDDEIDYGEEPDEVVKPEVNGINTSTDKNDNGVFDGSSGHSTWLALTSSEACVQLYLLADFSLAWQSNSLYPAPLRLDYVSSIAEEEEVGSMELAEVQLSHLGDTLHLTVAFENGLINVYEAVYSLGDDEDTLSSIKASKDKVLCLGFSKILARQLDGTGIGIMNPPNGDRLNGLNLIPFVNLIGQEGLFIGGLSPAWLLRSDQGITHFHMSAETSIDTLDVIQDAPANRRFLYSKYGMVHMAELPSLDLTHSIAHQRKAKTGRTYTKVAPHPFTKTVLAASILEHQFVLFDPEDGHVLEDPSVDPSTAKTYRSALELFADDDDEPIDGFEFDQCEVVCCVELVTLRSVATVSGLKDYIAVGTILSHGEDRPAKGATYLFDVVEVVVTDQDPACRFKLKLVMKDDAKGPITAITDMNGYLVTVMGLKLFVRSLEKDEWLITIAFLDTPFHATGITRLKNFLLLSDVKKSIWFIAFQEEPYRLVPISKDFAEMYASTANFIVQDDELLIISSCKEGVLRIHDYAPSMPASQGGQKLLTRSEFNANVEASCSLVIPGPAFSDGGISTSSEVVYGLMNGAIQSLLPVTEDVFSILHLLQIQLIRNVQHFSGLNPRGHRTVRNDFVSRPLTKGILDGQLLESFELLSRPKMDELARLIPDLVDGSDQLLRFIHTLRSNWGAL